MRAAIAPQAGNTAFGGAGCVWIGGDETRAVDDQPNAFGDLIML